MWELERDAQPRRTDAERPGGRDHAVERAVHALDLEDGARARGRAARWCSSRPSGRRSRARCSADLVAEAGFPPGVFNVVQGIGEEAGAALDAPSGRAPDLVHRLARDRRPHRHRGGLEPRPVHRRAGRQGPAARLRRLRPRGRGPEGRRPVRRRRTGVPRRHAAARRAERRATSSSSSSTASATSTCSATRGTTRRPSRR